MLKKTLKSLIMILLESYFGHLGSIMGSRQTTVIAEMLVVRTTSESPEQRLNIL